MVMMVDPSPLVELRESMPAMVDSCRSSGGGDGAGHGLRAGSRQVGPDLNGRKVDVRQVIDCQQLVSKGTKNHDRQHDQAGHDRTAE